MACDIPHDQWINHQRADITSEFIKLKFDQRKTISKDLLCVKVNNQQIMTGQLHQLNRRNI
ncbi:MAG: hypothetical protein U0930_05670 [Pirellulales bacterium]